MARSAPTCTKGTVGSTGTGQRRVIMDQIKTSIEAFQISAMSPWLRVDSYISTYRYDVYHGVGNPTLGSGALKGDSDLWFLLQEHGSGIYIKTMSDFCPSANTYQRLASGDTIAVDDSSGFDWWCAVNEYEFCFIIIQGGTCYALWAGQPLNGLSDSSLLGGRARLSVATGMSGDGVVLSLDRDLTGKLTAGQSIYLLNQTVDGEAGLDADYCEIVPVNSVGSSTVTVDSVDNNPYEIGSLVGLYPFCCVSGGAGVSFTNSIWCSIHPNGTTGAGSAGQSRVYFTSSEEPYMDPDYASIYRMARIHILALTSAGVYGTSQLMFSCSLGTQANGDRMLIDGDTSKAYWVFPSLVGNYLGGGCLAIGPGATV